LTLLSNKTRVKSAPASPYEENTEGEDDRFVSNFAALQSIATSHGQNDNGMFELNFRDERYLPFEGAGVVSRWRIELPRETNAFDLNTLTDVVLHLKYTAREGGDALRKAAQQALHAIIQDAESAPLMRLFSARHEFPNDWYRFLHPTDQSATSRSLTLDLAQERFPYPFKGKELDAYKIDGFLTFQDRADGIANYTKGSPLKFTLTPEGNASLPPDQLISLPTAFDGAPHAEIDLDPNLKLPAKLLLQVKEGDFKQSKLDGVDDMLFVFHYSVKDS
jgi:hypothetical protein